MGALTGLLMALGVAMVITSPSVRGRGDAGRASGPTSAARPPAPRSLLRGRATLLREAGLPASWAWRSLLGQAVLFLVGGLTAAGLTTSWVLALCAAPTSAMVVPLWLRRLRRVRRRELRETWPDVVDTLASSVRAGLAIPEAVGDLAVNGPVALRPAVGRAMAEFHASGRFDAGMQALRDEVADPVADRVVEVLRMARETGGSDLGQVLRGLSEMLRQDLRLRAELEARQSWTVNAARVAVAAPWLVLLLLGSTSSVMETYDTPGGALVLGVGFVTCAVAYRLMLTLGRVSEDIRVLR